MRKYYLDNIRWISILLLFIYHTCMMWNNFGSQFYVWGGENALASGFIIFLYPVFMPLLFAISGISAKFALQKRTPLQFVKERSIRILLPAVAGTLLIVPIQSYYAEKFHNGFTGNYWESLKLFFTRLPAESDFFGGFTPAHLWFLFYLFVISLVSLGIILIIKKTKLNTNTDKMPLCVIILLFILLWLGTPLIQIGGKSLIKYLFIFLLGYYVLSNETIMEKLEKYRYYLMCAYLAVNILHFVLFTYLSFDSGFMYDCFVSFTGWLGILAILSIGKYSLNFSDKVTSYFNTASFPIYIIHQTVLVALAYYVITYMTNIFVQFATIAMGSFIITLSLYEIIKRIPIVRTIFGIKSLKI